VTMVTVSRMDTSRGTYSRMLGSNSMSDTLTMS